MVIQRFVKSLTSIDELEVESVTGSLLSCLPASIVLRWFPKRLAMLKSLPRSHGLLFETKNRHLVWVSYIRDYFFTSKISPYDYGNSDTQMLTDNEQDPSRNVRLTNFRRDPRLGKGHALMNTSNPWSYSIF